MEAMVDGTSTEYLRKARRAVTKYVREHLDSTDEHVNFGYGGTFVVWFCKVLENWKAMVSTTLPDGMYYEVTYSGNKKETYVDAYKKFQNVVIPDDDS